jgi:hypothetical protein
LSEHLFTISQIAVAFAGFASLATVLGHRSRPQSALDAARLRVLLLYSLPVAFLALLPGLFAHYGLDEPRNWRAACAVLALVFLALGRFSRLREGLTQTRAAGLRHHPANLLSIAFLTAIPVAACAVVALGPGSGVAAPTFVLALILLLLVAAITFARLVLSLIGGDRAA